MTIIYVVTSGEYSDYSIQGIFSTEEKAETFKSKIGESHLEEWELDKCTADVVSAYWCSILDIATENLKPGTPGTLFAHPDARVDRVDYYDYSSVYYPKGHITATSFVSQKHADKLCTEKRQEVQRQGE